MYCHAHPQRSLEAALCSMLVVVALLSAASAAGFQQQPLSLETSDVGRNDSALSSTALRDSQSPAIPSLLHCPQRWSPISTATFCCEGVVSLLPLLQPKGSSNDSGESESWHRQPHRQTSQQAGQRSASCSGFLCHLDGNDDHDDEGDGGAGSVVPSCREVMRQCPPGSTPFGLENPPNSIGSSGRGVHPSSGGGGLQGTSKAMLKFTGLCCSGLLSDQPGGVIRGDSGRASGGQLGSRLECTTGAVCAMPGNKKVGYSLHCADTARRIHNH